MSSKKKLVISLSVAAAVLVAAIIAIVAVFAAATQSVATSTIKVSYRANAHVVGTASATYSFGNKTNHSMTTDGEEASDTNRVIKFDVDSGANDKSLQILKTDMTAAEGTAIPFGENARELVITFSFTNEGSKDYTATLTPTSLATTNMVVKYSATGGADDKEWSDSPAAVPVAAPTTQGGSNNASYFVKIYINDIAYDADFTGVFSWSLAA